MLKRRNRVKIFGHPNPSNFKCPICGTSEDKPVTLIGIKGTERQNIMQATQYHVDCLDLIVYKKGDETGNAADPEVISQVYYRK
jgi:hypothetical protein